jgi:hypothetical protein
MLLVIQSIIMFMHEGFRRISRYLPVGYRPRLCVKYLTVLFHVPHSTGYIINCGLKISKLATREWTKNNNFVSCHMQFLFGNFPRGAEEIFVCAK